MREQARALGLAGWVRNLPSGSVELVAAGEPEALQRLDTALRAGPPGARVEQVLRAPVEGESQLARPFAIAR